MKFGTRLAFIFIVVGFLPILIGGAFLLYFFNGYLKETTYNNLEKINEITVYHIESFIDDSYQSVNLLSGNEILLNEESTKEEVQRELEVIYSYYRNLFRDITFLDAEGRIIGSTSRRSYGRWETNPWFMRARATKDVVMSDMYAVTDPEDPILAIFVPNLNQEGEIVSFIVVQVNTEPLFRELDFTIGEEGFVVLINSRGDIIFHPKKENIFTKIDAGYPLEKTFIRGSGAVDFSIDGRDLVGNFQVLKMEDMGITWQVLISQPEEEALGFLRAMAVNYGLLSIVFLFPIIFSSFFISRKTMKPLKNLSITSKRVARGDLKAQAEVFSKDEFGELAENFNKMTKELAQAKKGMEEERDVLEIKVQARTKELNEINEKLEEEVQRRTEQMKRKLSELEKMSKLMVGRELKMIELKKEIKEKDEELEKFKGSEGASQENK